LRPILFLVSAASSYRLLKYVAEYLAGEGRPVAFLYAGGHDELFAVIQKDATALDARAYPLESLDDAQSGPAWRRHPRLVPAMVMWANVVLAARGDQADRLHKLRAILASQLGRTRRLLASLRPAAMVAGEDGISAPLAVHAAARHAGVPVVVVPFGYGVRRDLETALDAKAARGELVTATGRWAGRIRSLAPQWIKTGAHAGALMYEEDYVVAAESLGITLRDAWIIHGGFANRLCVESAQMQRVYRDEGVPEAKLAMTGTPYCDLMVRALERQPAARGALRQPRRITAGITRVLVSWPPSYHADRAQFSEFPTYRDMSVAILGWLQRQPGCDVRVSLHPATSPADRAALIDAGVVLTDEYVIELIPQHDVFITYFSSTIRWAVATGKPVINFDLYKLELHVYDAAPGVLRVSSLAEFQRVMTELITSDDVFAAVANRQIAVAPEWGALDGQSTQRIAGEILRLSA
jgi:hypothetical protein